MALILAILVLLGLFFIIVFIYSIEIDWAHIPLSFAIVIAIACGVVSVAVLASQLTDHVEIIIKW